MSTTHLLLTTLALILCGCGDSARLTVIDAHGNGPTVELSPGEHATVHCDADGMVNITREQP